MVSAQLWNMKLDTSCAYSRSRNLHRCSSRNPKSTILDIVEFTSRHPSIWDRGLPPPQSEPVAAAASGSVGEGYQRLWRFSPSSSPRSTTWGSRE